MNRYVTIGVACANVVEFEADVLVLKHADGLHGADYAIYQRLRIAHGDIELPPRSEWRTISSAGTITTQQVVFIGVGPLVAFDYPQIRDFGRTAITAVADLAPKAKHVALTLHGPGYGLDEIEAFDAELGGLLDGLRLGRVSPVLRQITFVERDERRAERLTARLDALLPGRRVRLAASVPAAERNESVVTAGSLQPAQPEVFVAMPFNPDMDDVYDYGIFKPAKESGFICERADREFFTDGIMQWVKNRIAAADVVVADVTGANPNVYLEVGYAWGLQKKTILVIRHPKSPPSISERTATSPTKPFATSRRS